MAPSNVLDTISGLPVHPLVVHASVVLVPLGTLALIACILVPDLRRRYAVPALLVFLIGAVSVVVSKESGEQLAHHVGDPGEHAEWGERLTVAAAATSLAAVAWSLLPYLHARAARAGRPTAVPGVRSVPARVLGVVTALLSVVTLGLVVATGHSGATATWQDQAEAWAAAAPSSTPTPSTPAPSAAPSATPARTTAPSAAATTAGVFTMAQVEAHDGATSCYVAIDGSVYDLTAWITRHPGGGKRITALCGTDGSAAFAAEHGEDGPQGEPRTTLARFRIGALAS